MQGRVRLGEIVSAADSRLRRLLRTVSLTSKEPWEVKCVCYHHQNHARLAIRNWSQHSNHKTKCNDEINDYATLMRY